MPKEVLSPLYPTPAGFEAETSFGLFKTGTKIKARAMQELMEFLHECAEENPQAA